MSEESVSVLTVNDRLQACEPNTVARVTLGVIPLSLYDRNQVQTRPKGQNEI